jgi:hypothetical protein
MKKFIIGFAVLLTILVLAATVPAMAGNTDKTTGGGWILQAQQQDNPKATFGFVAQGIIIDNIDPGKGHLTFNDHLNDVKIQSTEITDVSVIDNVAVFTGVAKVNGDKDNLVPFVCEVEDNGEPGKNVDTFFVSIPGYSAGESPLGGGNIQTFP